MAERPIYVPDLNPPYVKAKWIQFVWNPGFSIQQKQKNVTALHWAAKRIKIDPILEVSTKSESEIGRRLSAFNLTFTYLGSKYTVEAAFQASKVFEKGGPYLDLLQLSGREIKIDERLKNSGLLKAFLFDETRWELEPKTAFYDWLYLNALMQNSELSMNLLQFSGFTDIEFNPQKSINCQAKSCALFVSLYEQNLLKQALTSKQAFLTILKKVDTNQIGKQFSLL